MARPAAPGAPLRARGWVCPPGWAAAAAASPAGSAAAPARRSPASPAPAARLARARPSAPPHPARAASPHSTDPAGCCRGRAPRAAAPRRLHGLAHQPQPGAPARGCRRGSHAHALRSQCGPPCPLVPSLSAGCGQLHGFCFAKEASVILQVACSSATRRLHLKEPQVQNLLLVHGQVGCMRRSALATYEHLFLLAGRPIASAAHMHKSSKRHIIGYLNTKQRHTIYTPATRLCPLPLLRAHMPIRMSLPATAASRAIPDITRSLSYTPCRQRRPAAADAACRSAAATLSTCARAAVALWRTGPRSSLQSPCVLPCMDPRSAASPWCGRRMRALVRRANVAGQHLQRTRGLEVHAARYIIQRDRQHPLYTMPIKERHGRMQATFSGRRRHVLTRFHPFRKLPAGPWHCAGSPPIYRGPTCSTSSTKLSASGYSCSRPAAASAAAAACQQARSCAAAALATRTPATAKGSSAASAHTWARVCLRVKACGSVHAAQCVIQCCISGHGTCWH